MAPKQKRNRRRNFNPGKMAVNPPVQEALATAQPVNSSQINSSQIKSTQPLRQAAAQAMNPRVNVLNELSRIGIVTGIVILILILLYIFLK